MTDLLEVHLMKAVGCHLSDLALRVLTLHRGSHVVAVRLHVQHHRLHPPPHIHSKVKCHLTLLGRF